MNELIVPVLRLLADYGRLIDGREATAWSGLFGDGGVLAIGDREVTGAAELTEFALQSPAGGTAQPSATPAPAAQPTPSPAPTAPSNPH